MTSPLSHDIRQAYARLLKILIHIPISKRQQKLIDGTGGLVSVADLIAYQIGWGKCLIRWYEAGIKGESPDMPGEGFSKWDYTAIAKHFYEHYRYDAADHQINVFEQTISHILNIVEAEDQRGNLDRLDVWPWCTLSSGKSWPLSKWIRVNTVSPYQRASQLLSKAQKSYTLWNK